MPSIGDLTDVKKQVVRTMGEFLKAHKGMENGYMTYINGDTENGLKFRSPHVESMTIKAYEAACRDLTDQIRRLLNPYGLYVDITVGIDGKDDRYMRMYFRLQRIESVTAYDLLRPLR